MLCRLKRSSRQRKRRNVIDTPTIVADSRSVDGMDKPSTSTARTTDDVGSATLVSPNPFNKYKQDRSMITGWMGSWRTGKLRRPSAVSRIHPQSRLPAPPSEPTSSGFVVVKWPNQAKKRRTTKTVFGTLGKSIINPTISTTPMPTTSVTVPTLTAPTVEISSTASATEEIPASTDTRKTSATAACTTPTTNNDLSIVVLASPLLRTTFSVPLAPAEPRLEEG